MTRARRPGQHVPVPSDISPPLDLHEPALAELEACRAACESEAGGCAVMAAVAVCATHSLVMPRWLSDAFIRMRSRVVEGYVVSWDDAIGRAWPRGARPKDIRRLKLKKARIHAAVWNRVKTDPETPINRILFDEIGEIPGIDSSGSTVDRLYYQALKEGALNIAEWRLERSLT